MLNEQRISSINPLGYDVLLLYIKIPHSSHCPFFPVDSLKHSSSKFLPGNSSFGAISTSRVVSPLDDNCYKLPLLPISCKTQSVLKFPQFSHSAPRLQPSLSCILPMLYASIRLRIPVGFLLVFLLCPSIFSSLWSVPQRVSFSCVALFLVFFGNSY